MDEHKTQQPEPEIVPARRKSGRMRSWKASILACVICILVTALVTSLIFVGKFGGSRNYKLALKFAQVKQVVDKNYIGDADDTAISDAASSAIISAIGDKWSYYMTAEEYKAYQMYSNNEYAGIGVTIQLDDKTKGFRITAVTSDSPAAISAGVKFLNWGITIVLSRCKYNELSAKNIYPAVFRMPGDARPSPEHPDEKSGCLGKQPDFF